MIRGRIILLTGIIASLYRIGRPEPMQIKLLNMSTLQQDLRENKIIWYQALGVRNHVIGFPTILIIYLLHLVITQTSLGGWDGSIWFLLIDNTFLMTLLIVSGVATVRESHLTDRYTTQRSHIYIRYAYIGLCLGLGLLTYYILQIQLQAEDVSYIYTAIAVCAGWLIWLVGIVIGDEEEEKAKQ